jgi:isopenicillin-N epimerase
MFTMSELSAADDFVWDHWRQYWRLRPGTIYLNHGSFGPPPEPVRAARRQWQQRLDSQPMDFFVRQYEPAWRDARRKLANFVGSSSDNLILVDNATTAMNVVADSFPLRPGDEVLLTDHEYGAVQRIWQRACQQAGAASPKTAEVPLPVHTTEQVVDAILAAVNERTRLIVVSHISSPTAIIFPVRDICHAARQRGIPVCVDGPHAPAQIALHIDQLDCDFYTASCHKWLSAPFGSGFLYVCPKQQSRIRPPVLSWGRLRPEQPATWADEFIWSGTRDPSAYLSIPAAIDFLESVPLETFRAGTHELARYARQRLVELTAIEPPVPDSKEWFASMALVPLPPGDRQSLQDALWKRYAIEVPIVDWGGGRYIRVSCHLYNRSSDLDVLVRSLRELLE